MQFHFIPISWCGRHTVVLAVGRGLEQVVFLGGHHGGVWIGRIDVGDPGLSRGILAFHPEVLLGSYYYYYLLPPHVEFLDLLVCTCDLPLDHTYNTCNKCRHSHPPPLLRTKYLIHRKDLKNPARSPDGVSISM